MRQIPSNRPYVPPSILTAQQSEDFIVYQSDHHLMNDTITTAREDEMRGWLVLLKKNWPTALAHTMAIALPNTEIQFDTVEVRLQEALPGM